MEKKLNRFFIYRSVQIPISMKIILFQISCILVQYVNRNNPNVINTNFPRRLTLSFPNISKTFSAVYIIAYICNIHLPVTSNIHRTLVIVIANTHTDLYRSVGLRYPCLLKRRVRARVKYGNQCFSKGGRQSCGISVFSVQREVRG